MASVSHGNFDLSSGAVGSENANIGNEGGISGNSDSTSGGILARLREISEFFEFDVAKKCDAIIIREVNVASGS